MKIFIKIILMFLLPVQVSYAEYTLALVGTKPASTVKTAQCSSGYLPVGLKVKAGTYVDSLFMLCGKRTSATTVSYGSNNAKTVSLGSSPLTITVPGVSSVYTQKLCPDNYKLTGIKFKHGDYVDKVVNMQCTKLRSSTVKVLTINAGGNGGSYATRYCKPGTGIHKMKGYYGGWTNKIEIVCK